MTSDASTNMVMLTSAQKKLEGEHIRRSNDIYAAQTSDILPLEDTKRKSPGDGKENATFGTQGSPRAIATSPEDKKRSESYKYFSGKGDSED